MEEPYKITIDKIELLCRKEPGFAQELRRRLGVATTSQLSSDGNNFSQDLSDIRESILGGSDRTHPVHLDLAADVCNAGVEENVLIMRQLLSTDPKMLSIDYSFVRDPMTRHSLETDNLCMERSALNIVLPDNIKHTFIGFCFYAVSQEECMVTYLFDRLYPPKKGNCRDLENAIRYFTLPDGADHAYRPKPATDKYPVRGAADVSLSQKLNAVCNMLFPQDESIKMYWSNLRVIRNLFAHPNGQIPKNAKSHVDRMLEECSFWKVRKRLREMVSAIWRRLEDHYQQMQ